MKLIVGLGNPGSEYLGTRHNVGFEVIDALATRLGWISPGSFDRVAKQKYNALTFDGSLMLANGSSEKLLLMKPTTFMNLSGKCVRVAMDFFQTAISDVMVIVDDLALPCGSIRIRSAGSSGGQNGLKDIERVLGTNAYPRLRLGIDPTSSRMAGKDYVLQAFSPEQRTRLEPAITRACGAIVTWADRGIDVAMSQFNNESAVGAGQSAEKKEKSSPPTADRRPPTQPKRSAPTDQNPS